MGEVIYLFGQKPETLKYEEPRFLNATEIYHLDAAVSLILRLLRKHERSAAEVRGTRSYKFVSDVLKSGKAVVPSKAPISAHRLSTYLSDLTRLMPELTPPESFFFKPVANG